MINDEGSTLAAYLWWGILCVIILLIVVAVPCSSLVIAPGGVIARIGLLLVLVVLVIVGSVSRAGLPWLLLWLLQWFFMTISRICLQLQAKAWNSSALWFDSFSFQSNKRKQAELRRGQSITKVIIRWKTKTYLDSIHHGRISTPSQCEARTIRGRIWSYKK